MTAPSIGPPGLRAYGSKTKGCPPEEARLSGGYRLPACMSSTRLAPSGRLGQQILEICYRSRIGISDHISRKSNCRVSNLCCTPTAMRSVMERESVLPVPMLSALIETFAVHLLFGTLALAPVPAAFLLAAPETDPVIRRTAVRFGTPALLAILIEIDYHRRLHPPLP